MKHYQALLVSSAAAILLSAGMSASAATLDFEGLPTATAIETNYPGVTISATGGKNEAWVYNTGPGGDTADPDLSAPFTGINPNGPATISPGNVLIVQELDNADSNTGVEAGPDDNGNGGMLFFVFDNAVTVQSMDVFDMRSNSTIQLFSDASFSSQIGTDFVLGDADTGNDPTDNKYERVIFGNVAGVRSLKVTMLGSGAVDNLSYVPLPAAAWLFGSALLGLVGIARRKTA